MDVEFRDKKLALIETDRAAAETGLAIALIESARDKLNYIRQAVDERDLRNWKSLHFEKLEGDRSGQRSIRLTSNFGWYSRSTMNASRRKLQCYPLRITTRSDGYGNH